MLEKPCAQNIAAWEDHGKQCLKSIKINQFLTIKKKTGDHKKKTRRLTEIQFLTKSFTSYKTKSDIIVGSDIGVLWPNFG